MRNTYEYPITRDEILETIKRAINDQLYNDKGEMVVGSVGPMILQRLHDRLANNEHLLKNVFGGHEEYKV